jgi:hypothetical protein
VYVPERLRQSSVEQSYLFRKGLTVIGYILVIFQQKSGHPASEYFHFMYVFGYILGSFPQNNLVTLPASTPPPSFITFCSLWQPALSIMPNNLVAILPRYAVVPVSWMYFMPIKAGIGICS